MAIKAGWYRYRYQQARRRDTFTKKPSSCSQQPTLPPPICQDKAQCTNLFLDISRPASRRRKRQRYYGIEIRLVVKITMGMSTLRSPSSRTGAKFGKCDDAETPCCEGRARGSRHHSMAFPSGRDVWNPINLVGDGMRYTSSF